MEQILINALNTMLEQSPIVAVLVLLLWRIETRLAGCMEHTQELIERVLAALLEKRD